jgi:hypothetical protein
MRLFGAKRDPDTRPSGLLEARWFKALLSFCAVLVVLTVCIEIYRRAVNYGTKVVEAHPVDADIALNNLPKWLHPDIVRKLHDEARDFARRDQATYDRVRNILDNEVLQQIADLYTGADTIDGKAVNRQSVGFNAWIKKIIKVDRNIAKDKSHQTIEIFVEWRKPAAWVRVPAQDTMVTGGGGGDMLCLIDADGVRLPGDYQLSDRSKSNLLVLTGIDLPTIDGKSKVPLPGERWTAGTSDQLGDDFLAGMKLLKLLETQPFASQIDAVDMSNFSGKKDPRAPWIVLNTIWQTEAGAPRVVQWGRPVGEEKYYEVQATAKVRALNDIYLRYNRIDAGRDYVDIRTELVRLPKLASQVEPPPPPVRG